MAGRFGAAERLAKPLTPPPRTTAHGALLGHITGGHLETIDAGGRSYQPMNISLGLFPPLARSPSRAADATGLRGTARTRAEKRAMSRRALGDLALWIAGGDRSL